MISTEFIKGSLKTIVLKVLKEDGPMHGYALTKRVEELTEGKIKLTYGNIYPLLHKLEKEKVLVTARDISTGRMRIGYALTPKGESLVTQKIKEIKEFIETLQIIVDLKPGLKYA
ncbi:MAG: PadR family transcriptional regulator [Bacteroidota bacterium]|nr:PadR family transcriptional regulator [Bacteroidota bacterium]